MLFNAIYIQKRKKSFTWIARTAPSLTPYGSNICYGNDLFASFAYNSAPNDMMTSPDGINWTLRTTPGDVKLMSVCYGNGLYVAVGDYGPSNNYSNTTMISFDGINWEVVTAPTSVSGLNGVCYGNGRFVAVGPWGNKIISMDL